MDGRPLFERSQERRVVESYSPRDEAVLVAHGFNEPLLTSGEDFEWQRLKIAEHPHQINALPNGRFQIPRPEWGKYSQHPIEEFFSPHTRDQAPGISPQN